MQESKFFIKYAVNGVVYENDLHQTQHYNLVEDSSTSGLKLILHPIEPMELIKVSLTYQKDFGENDKFFANGYQSWTTSMEFGKQHTMRSVTKIASLPSLRALASISGDYLFYDYSLRPGRFHGYTYGYIRRGNEIELYGSLNERTGFTVLSVDMNEGKLVLHKEVEGTKVDAPYELFDIYHAVGDYDRVFDGYFGSMNLPKPRVEHMAGYTSWYNYFQAIDENIILRDLKGLQRAGTSADIFQIDDGYETFVGDWLDPNPATFPKGMKYIADQVHAAGYKAGIWLAPFNAQKASKLAKEHPDWLIKGKNGKPLLGCAGWGGAYTMDVYHPEAREYIRKVFDTVLNDWGYDMVKLDFLYSQCMEPRNGKSRGTIMCDAMEFLRSCVGDKILLGCGVPLGAAFGYVDACRISCDVDLKYKGKYYNKLHINNEIPSAQNAILNSIFRRHLNGRVFANDPDVFFLREWNLTFTDEQQKILATVNQMFGDILFVSDNVGEYDESTLKFLKETFVKPDIKIRSVDMTLDYKITVDYVESGKEKKFVFSLRQGKML